MEFVFRLWDFLFGFLMFCHYFHRTMSNDTIRKIKVHWKTWFLTTHILLWFLSALFSHDLCEKTLRWEWKNIEESFLCTYLYFYLMAGPKLFKRKKFVACHFFRAHKAFIFLFLFLKERVGGGLAEGWIFILFVFF